MIRIWTVFLLLCLLATSAFGGHWHIFSGPLTNSRVTFTTNNYRFFRVVGSNGLTNCITILDDDRFGTGRTDVYWMAAWIGYKTFTTNDCAVGEGCASPGYRKLLRFPVSIYNPSTNTFWSGPQGPFYYYDQCHRHFHITNFSAFTLLSDSGVVAGSVKMGWCVRSFGKLVDLGWNTNPPSSSCTSPVLMPGWGDTYNVQDCMWFDVTSLPDGIYTMRVELDPTGAYGFRQRSEHRVRMIGDVVVPYP